MTPRVEPLPRDDAVAAAEAAGVPVPFVDLNVFRVLLRHPKLAKPINDMLLALLAQPKLDPRLRELVIMRLGWRTGSVYEWTQHWPIALRCNLGEDDILAVRDWPDTDAFGPAERAVLRATDDTLDHGRISDETWTDCAAHLGDDETRLELVAAIGLWRMIAGLLRTLDIPLEDGVDPWPPDGRAP